MMLSCWLSLCFVVSGSPFTKNVPSHHDGHDLEGYFGEREKFAFVFTQSDCFSFNKIV